MGHTGSPTWSGAEIKRRENLPVLGDQEFADLYRANWKPRRTASVLYGGALQFGPAAEE